MWEDILKLRQYELGDERRSSGRVAFNALEKIVNDLRAICNLLNLDFKVNRPNVYNDEIKVDYYRMLERLNSIIYGIANNPKKKDWSRDSERVRNKIKFKRKAELSYRAFIGNRKGLKIILATRKMGSSISPFHLNMTVYFPKEINSAELKNIKEKFTKYFTDNFDNGNLDVEAVVDNIFNNLELTIEEQEPELEPEGTIREKWWE